jgi:hypothetical protein
MKTPAARTKRDMATKIKMIWTNTMTMIKWTTTINTRKKRSQSPLPRKGLNPWSWKFLMRMKSPQQNPENWSIPTLRKQIKTNRIKSSAKVNKLRIQINPISDVVLYELYLSKKILIYIFTGSLAYI